MSGMSTVVAGGNFGANAKDLIKLRNDWDKLLLEAAGLIAANPPEFELRYFTDIEPLELTEENYNKGTMSFRVGAPYLMQTSGWENDKIAADLRVALESIPESKNWGAKMNGFPWTYADDIAGDNWLKWANTEKTETYPCTVTLLDANKKTIAKKPYTLYVGYDKKYADFGIYNEKTDAYSFYRSLSSRTLTASPSLTISDVPVGNADTDKIYISVENTGSKKISVLPSDGMSMNAAINAIKTGSHNGMVKIGGFIGNNGVSSIGKAVKSNKKPVALDLSELVGVTEIPFNAFYRCTSLTSMVIPDSVTRIDWGAFSGCTSLKNVTIPEGVTYIGEGAFSGCISLETMTIPDGVIEIEKRAFQGCESLKSVTIPESATYIGEGAFSVCTSLASVTIPMSVTGIGLDAFNSCKSLKKIYYAGSKEQWENIKIQRYSYGTPSTVPNKYFDRAKKQYNYKGE